jgi:hypothetical protein
MSAATASPSKGSLIRITTTAGIKATAVKIGTGTEVLEVKRNGVVGRKLYSSVTDWEGSFGADPISSQSVEERAAAPAAPAAVRPAAVKKQTAASNPTTPDMAFVQNLYRRYNKKSYSKLKPTKVEKHVSIIDRVTELKRLLALNPSPYNADTITRMRQYVQSWEVSATSPHYANDKSRMVSWTVGRTFYVRDPATAALTPILWGKTYVHEWDRRCPMYNALSHIMTAPMQDWICYKGTAATSFAELGVPVGPDGKPEIWVAWGRYGAIERLSAEA